ncbi:nucleotide-binding protein [Ruegeria sp. TM1040]|jgi:exonuclease VII large subunit|uniref:nucleotide-binding protein n=1 Tax=Rhodobacterales TaxID=204455 RepID=UPI0000D7C743|nr:nucleotide-binding protein [Ruegeria sp. TM1040]ABF61920.1 nucleic acid binding OB-fold tRNA/helicase-type [Ruegeria sp. TM1040]MDF9301064.1 nucleotide-binding protein [Tritonibacter mobilis]
MRHVFQFISALGVALFLTTCVNAETIGPREAAQNIGSYSTVEGVVSQVSRSRNGTTFINFGGRFPNHVFYGVIFKKHAHKFQNLDGLVGKSVAIGGTINLYKGKPQIIVFSPEQITQR